MLSNSYSMENVYIEFHEIPILFCRHAICFAMCRIVRHVSNNRLSFTDVSAYDSVSSLGRNERKPFLVCNIVFAKTFCVLRARTIFINIFQI